MSIRSARAFFALTLVFPHGLLAGSHPSSAAPPAYETALVTRMRMVQCQEPPRRGGFMTNFMIGSAPPTPMGPADCPEYEIEGVKVTYRIRPRRDLLLPVGDEVKFRIHKRDLLVLAEDANKEIVFSVVAMTLKTKRSTPELVAEHAAESRSRKCLTMEGEVVPCGEQ